MFETAQLRVQGIARGTQDMSDAAIEFVGTSTGVDPASWDHGPACWLWLKLSGWLFEPLRKI